MTEMETLLKTASKQEAETVMQFLAGMTPVQKNKILVFMQGVCFANKLQEQSGATEMVAR